MSRLSNGLRENPDLLEKAGVDGRPVGRLALRSVSSGASHQSNARSPALVPALFAGQREVVAVEHRGAAGEAQDRQDIGGGAAPDLLGVVGVVSDEPAADLGAIGSAHDDGVAEKIRGRSSAEVLSILGFTGRTAMIHRDDLALAGE